MSRPDSEQDKPTGAFAKRFPAPDPGAPSSGASDSEAGPVAERLRLGNGVTTAERPEIVERFSSLDNVLGSVPATELELELSVKDRDRPGQTTTLQCWIAGRPRLVATSAEADLTAALVEVRDDLRRQLDDSRERNAAQRQRR